MNPTAWFITALTGDADTPMDWRCIHDKGKALPAHNYHGSFAELQPVLEDYNARGYGIFTVIQQLDGQGRELANVAYCRAHLVDLDNTLTAQAGYDRAAGSGASFAVQSSPGKFHVYWRTQPYTGNDFFTAMQRKLAQLYDGDRKIIDPTRVMRVPGFLHQKGEPFMVSGWPLAGFDRVWTAAEIEVSLQHVNVFDHASTRSPLGTPEMAAPSLDWLRFALSLVDPNELDRGEWLSMSAAIKQAGWNHTDPATLRAIWDEWCNRYALNDVGENTKLWDSIRDTEVGWTSIERRSPVKAYMMFGFKDAPAPVKSAPVKSEQAQTQEFGEILSPEECKQWFKDCYFVDSAGQIINRSGRFMNQTQFNGCYGGKQFIVTSTGKVTDEPWKAALRSTCWTIPKVDHTRFLPERPTFEIVEDALGRAGLNTYIPARIDARPGDVTLWMQHLEKILPIESDRKIFCDYMAHCVKYPGYKIPWAPLLQSAEGIGKTVFFEVMQHALGDFYVYTPNAQKLIDSGSTFNAWQRGKLLIVVNEIKIDERRELIEILKPWITDARIEVQRKGVDQSMEDNTANWLLFSNFKNAIPISANGRRYAIFYSVLQSANDIAAAGMDDAYFQRLWGWLREGGGLQAVTHWLLEYPIERGGLPARAPETSSHGEALIISRSPLEICIEDCITDGLPGFRGGYVSTLAVIARAKATGMRAPNTGSVHACLENMGYTAIGRAVRPYMQESVANRTELFARLSTMTVEGYGAAQGYE